MGLVEIVAGEWTVGLTGAFVKKGGRQYGRPGVTGMAGWVSPGTIPPVSAYLRVSPG